MVHPADDAMAEALKAIPISERVLANPRTVFGRKNALIDIPYNDVVELAAKTMRSGMSRADAVEMAYDHRLHKGTLNGWERTGEVTLSKKLGYVRALCRLKEGG